jgi:carbonic anhydrase
MAAAQTANQIIAELIAGNHRFVTGSSLKLTRSSIQTLKSLATTEPSPRAIVLACSDSRAPVEIIFDQDVGDLFVIRVAGNIVAPSLVGSVEFAATALRTHLVVVLGHSECKAVGATLDHIQNTLTIPSENIHDIVARIKPHIYQIGQSSEIPLTDRLKLAVDANVRASVNQLSRSSRLIESLVKDGALTIVGAVLDLKTGIVDFAGNSAMEAGNSMFGV